MLPHLYPNSQHGNTNDADEEEEGEDAGNEEGTEADNNAPTAGADKGKGVVDADSNPGSSAPTASGSGRVA